MRNDLDFDGLDLYGVFFCDGVCLILLSSTCCPQLLTASCHSYHKLELRKETEAFKVFGIYVVGIGRDGAIWFICSVYGGAAVAASEGHSNGNTASCPPSANHNLSGLAVCVPSSDPWCMLG